MPVSLPAFADDHERRWFDRFCREVWIQSDYGLYAWKDIKAGQAWGGSGARVIYRVCRCRFPGLRDMKWLGVPRTGAVATNSKPKRW